MTIQSNKQSMPLRDDIKLCVDIARAFNDCAGGEGDRRFYRSGIMQRISTYPPQPRYPDNSETIGIKDLWEMYEPYLETLPELKAALIVCWLNILEPSNIISFNDIMNRYNDIHEAQTMAALTWKGTSVQPVETPPFDIIVRDIANDPIGALFNFNACSTRT